MQFYLALSSGDCSWVSPGMGAFKNNVFQLESKKKDFFFLEVLTRLSLLRELYPELFGVWCRVASGKEQ